MGGVGKKLVTKTRMWESFLQGHILSIGGVDSTYRIGLSFKTGTHAHWFYILLYTYLNVGWGWENYITATQRNLKIASIERILSTKVPAPPSSRVFSWTLVSAIFNRSWFFCFSYVVLCFVLGCVAFLWRKCIFVRGSIVNAWVLLHCSSSKRGSIVT